MRAGCTCGLDEQKGKALGVCDPLDASCVEDDREIYVRDSEFMYCGDKAVECACSREYLHCMIKAGCAAEGSEGRDEFVEQCVTTGCSAKQCGLPAGTDVCHVSTPVCANRYFQCNAQAGADQCECTKELIGCRAGGGCTLDERIDSLSGFNAFDLCAAEGCSAAACGLPDKSERCNQTSLVCTDHYLGCASGLRAEMGFDAQDAAARQALRQPSVSQNMLEVTFHQGSPAGGSAIAWRGVHSGKYYWEIEVPGKCAVVGVAQESFAKFYYPGYDYKSWGYGHSQNGYEGELFGQGVGIPFGASITEPAVSPVSCLLLAAPPRRCALSCACASACSMELMMRAGQQNGARLGVCCVHGGMRAVAESCCRVLLQRAVAECCCRVLLQSAGPHERTDRVLRGR